MTVSSQLLTAATNLRDAVDSLTFSPPVAHVYNPLDCAWEAHKPCLSKDADTTK